MAPKPRRRKLSTRTKQVNKSTKRATKNLLRGKDPLGGFRFTPNKRGLPKSAPPVIPKTRLEQLDSVKLKSGFDSATGKPVQTSDVTTGRLAPPKLKPSPSRRRRLSGAGTGKSF